MVTYNIYGHEYPMAYTVGVQDKISKRFGSLESLGETMEGFTASEKLDAFVFIASAEMEGYVEREKAKAAMLGDHFEATYPTYEQLKAVLSMGDLPSLIESANACMNEGNERTVFLEAASSKNIEARE